MQMIVNKRFEGPKEGGSQTYRSVQYSYGVRGRTFMTTSGIPTILPVCHTFCISITIREFDHFNDRLSTKLHLGVLYLTWSHKAKELRSSPSPPDLSFLPSSRLCDTHGSIAGASHILMRLGGPLSSFPVFQSIPSEVRIRHANLGE